jgi:hypothetical protein
VEEIYFPQLNFPFLPHIVALSPFVVMIIENIDCIVTEQCRKIISTTLVKNTFQYDANIDLESTIYSNPYKIGSYILMVSELLLQQLQLLGYFFP